MIDPIDTYKIRAKDLVDNWNSLVESMTLFHNGHPELEESWHLYLFGPMEGRLPHLYWGNQRARTPYDLEIPRLLDTNPINSRPTYFSPGIIFKLYHPSLQRFSIELQQVSTATSMTELEILLHQNYPPDAHLWGEVSRDRMVTFTGKLTFDTPISLVKNTFDDTSYNQLNEESRLFAVFTLRHTLL